MGKKFNRWLRNAARLGINVGDINQATAMFTGQQPQQQQQLPDVPTPPEIQSLQRPLEVQGSNRTRLASQSRARRRRASARKGKKSLTTGLATGLTGGFSTPSTPQGGVSF